jgi:peptide deformylase
MIDDIITINTDNNTINEKILPYNILDLKSSILKRIIPEYTGSLPNSNITNIAARLKMTMKLFGGVGLSANQCGISERLFIIGADDFYLTCINPKIIASDNTKVKQKEGCLSAPGIFINIARSPWVDVEYLDLSGNINSIKLTGVTARIFQHELEHLDGKSFLDYAGPVAIKLAEKRKDLLYKKITRRKKVVNKQYNIV